jgi:D-alanyl-D-alanine carboxypeptidase/D-alanyl-D-alanine-endopeptidase (penicillin-binding protein 4)
MPVQRRKPFAYLRTLAAVALAISVFRTPVAAAPNVAPARLRDEMTEVIASLRSDLSAILHAASGRWRTSRWSVLAVSLDQGDTLFAENATEVLAPASNMKLLTTATAIQRLGASFRYQTFLLASGGVNGSRLEGDLILYGTGDPGLSDRFEPGGRAVFEAFADSLLAAGIYTIAGDVVGDGSYFSGPLLGEGWNPDDLNDAFAAPSGALAFNENIFQLRVLSNGPPGLPPEILTIPQGAGVPIQNNAVLGGNGRLLVLRPSPTAPIIVQGGVPAGSHEVWRQLTVPDPAHFAASVLASVLEEKGIVVEGQARAAYDGSASVVTGRRFWAAGPGRSAPRVVARHVSPPLLDYLTVVNKRSHNLLADHVLKTVGRVLDGDGSYEGGSHAVMRFLSDSVGVSSALEMHDGSGLSTMNRVSASDFVSLLSYMSDHGDWANFWSTLPEAGNPRELRRMYRTPAAGNLRAKTGTIQNVSALSGMVHSATGERIAFSIIVNDAPSTSRAKGIEDQIGTRLAGFERIAKELNITFAEAQSDSLAEPDTAADTDPATGSAVTPATGNPPKLIAPPLATPGPAAAPAAGESRRHQVQKGESFAVIARRYGVAVDALVGANPELSPRRLQPGDWVKIP